MLSMNASPLDAQELLARSGLRATRQRIALLAHLMGARRPETAEELASALVHTLDPVTVYRAVKEMHEAGLVRRVELGTVSTHYEFVRFHHHHLVCRACGRVEDIAACVTEPSRTRLKKAGFARIDDHALEFFGWCVQCA